MTGSDFNAVRGAWGCILLVLLGSLLVFPLGIWKLVEILFWLWHHIHVGVH